jgi:RimJ/RimL family protein N-acetyltransferase
MVHNDIDLMIEDKVTGKPIGFLSIYDQDPVNNGAEISFLIGENELRGKGLGKEIAKIGVSICFDELKLNRVVASATVENVRSVKALEAVGFKRVGLLREYQIVDGKKYDEHLLEMLRDDYLKLKGPQSPPANPQ